MKTFLKLYFNYVNSATVAEFDTSGPIIYHQSVVSYKPNTLYLQSPNQRHKRFYVSIGKYCLFL